MSAVVLEVEVLDADTARELVRVAYEAGYLAALEEILPSLDDADRDGAE